jgi:hypothetical protein
MGQLDSPRWHPIVHRIQVRDPDVTTGAQAPASNCQKYSMAGRSIPAESCLRVTVNAACGAGPGGYAANTCNRCKWLALMPVSSKKSLDHSAGKQANMQEQRAGCAIVRAATYTIQNRLDQPGPGGALFARDACIVCGDVRLSANVRSGRYPYCSGGYCPSGQRLVSCGSTRGAVFRCGEARWTDEARPGAGNRLRDVSRRLAQWPSWRLLR